LYHNLEANAVIHDRNVAAVLEQIALEDMRESVEITLEAWRNRWWVSRLISWVVYRLRWWL
jgi:cardiolipin synthase